MHLDYTQVFPLQNQKGLKVSKSLFFLYIYIYMETFQRFVIIAIMLQNPIVMQRIPVEKNNFYVIRK
jgi:hypothetical protein